VLSKTDCSTPRLETSFRTQHLIPLVLMLLASGVAGQVTSVRFAPPVSIPTAAQWVATGDLNGDGKADIVAAGGNTVFVALGNGDGTFHSTTSYSLAVSD